MMAASISHLPVATIAVIVVTYLHITNAFSNTALSRKGGIAINHCSRLKSDKHDSTSTEGKHTHEVVVDPIRRRRHRNLEHWGVEHLASPSFPSTFEEVADEVFGAISGTICGLQRPDPNIASNAMHKSVLDYRPTHLGSCSKQRWVNEEDNDVPSKKTSRKEKNVPCRMGIEIDGAAYLSDSNPNDEGRAMRILSLHIAKRLSALPWDDMESHVGRRSVAVYYNSVQQSLLASSELSRWKEEENNPDHDSLDHIHIHSLGQDSLPSSMVKGKSKRNEQGSKSNNTSTDPKESIILIVKPTDYDADSLIPIHGDSRSSSPNERRPTIQASIVDKLQSLLFQASASSIPAVVMSPRLSELPPLQQLSAEAYKRTGPSGFEQSGFQKSATYGGIEPPVGPTSWLLRDLVPPVYVWVGRANSIGQRKHAHRSLKSIAASFRKQQYDDGANESTDKEVFRNNDEEATYSYYSRMALTQSAMETGHSWHMFVVKEKLKPTSSSGRGARILDQVQREISYHYMGSSTASRGRPSSRILTDVFEEFCENSSDKK